ncbi:MAG TPA: alpha/beta hydrolase-fold protein [Rubricoccaceae bacterium]|nr:alpha/beta hydrolase-fold protein [Rubricoccaceae bacterium]
MRFSVLTILAFMVTPALAQPVSFASFLAEAEAADPADRPALVEAFWQRLEKTPLVENDTTAVFLYRGEATTVGLNGDPGQWAETLPLTRLGGTDLWYRRVTLEPDARIEYVLMVDTAAEGFGAELEGIPDPRNPHRVESGFGPFSELAMPGYEYPEVFAPVRDGTPGSFEGLDLHTLPAGVLPYPHEVLVYTPPGYDADTTRRYPAVYFQDGRDYVAFAHVPRVLDWLIERGAMEPAVAVFIDPPNRHRPDAPNRVTEYGMNDAYVAFVADEVVPFVDATYRTNPSPARRLVVGDSYGGLIVTYIAFRRPDVFGLAYSQSGYHSFQGDRMIRLIGEAQPVPIRLYVDVGIYERVVGAGMLPEEGRDFLAANRRLRDALEARGYDFVYAEYPQGHTWGNWRAHLLDALPHFFPSQNR